MIGTNKRGKPVMLFYGNEILATSEFMKVLKHSNQVVHTRSESIWPNLWSTPIYRVKERELRRRIKLTQKVSGL